MKKIFNKQTPALLLSNNPSNFLDFVNGHRDFKEELESSRCLGFN